MIHLIDKDALIAEIDNLVDKGKHHDNYKIAFRDGNNSALYALKGRIDTLEMKEVDLDREISFQWSKFCLNCKDKDSFVKVAKHFFELGLKAQKGEEI